jgi:hypothetical protein
MHECPACYYVCDCDGEDTWMDAQFEGCLHDCDPEDLEDDVDEEELADRRDVAEDYRRWGTVPGAP